MAVSLPPGVDLNMIPSMAPPPGVVSNFINPVTLANPILAVCTATSALAIILLCMRLYSTTRITRSASYDDAAVVVALVLSFCYSGVVIDFRDNARHGWDLPLSAYTPGFAKVVFAEQIFSGLSLFFGKVSILLLLFRLFAPTRWFRYMIYLGIAWTTLITLVSIIVAAALCTPRHGEAFGDVPVAERCSKETTWALIGGISDVVVDLFIIYLPIPMLWKLNMGLQRKIGIMAIFLTGFVACMASILGLVYRVKLFENSDTLWQTGVIEILVVIELNVSIMVACMPACAVLFRYYITKFNPISTLRTRFSSQHSSKHHKSSHSHHKFSHSRASTIVASASRPSESYGDENAKKTNHWRVKNLFNSNVAPQITRDHTQSGVLKTVDFDVFDERKELAKPEPGSIELREMGPDAEKTSATAPFDMV